MEQILMGNQWIVWLIILFQQRKKSNMKGTKKYSQKRVFRKKTAYLPKTKFRVRNVATRLEHRRVEGKK
jgi:hypothetical protein